MLPESIRVGCSPTNSPGQPRRPGRDWSRCSTMPGPETPWSLPRSTGSADPSPRSPAPSPISVNGESRCMSYAKASIRPHQQGELSRPSWPASQYWSSNWAASAAPHPENPVAPGICRPPNPRSSAQNGKNSLRDSGPRLQRHRDRVAWQGILDRGATGLGAGRGPQAGDRRGPRRANLRRGACAGRLLCDARLTVSDSGDLGDGARPGTLRQVVASLVVIEDNGAPRSAIVSD